MINVLVREVPRETAAALSKIAAEYNISREILLRLVFEHLVELHSNGQFCIRVDMDRVDVELEEK